MLSRLFGRINKRDIIELVHYSKAFSVGVKNIVDKKKRIYETQATGNNAGNDLANLAKIELKKTRFKQFQLVVYELGKEMLNCFSSMNNKKKQIEIVNLFKKHKAKIIKENWLDGIDQLINYVQIVKSISLSKLEENQHLEIAYQELVQLLNKQNIKKLLKNHFTGLWNDNISIQMKIRSITLLQFIDQKQRNNYLQKVIPYVKYFKTIEILIVLYEKWRYNYPYSYELINQIHQNQYFSIVDDIQKAYVKMLFISKIKGEFNPNQDGFFSRILNSVTENPNILVHSAFSKLIKMLHSQSFYVQTEASRSSLEFSLNNFINIAKNQNYGKDNMNLSQLVEIYLSFEESKSTGEILLNEITYFSKITNFQLSKQNFKLYKKLLMCVLKNIEIKLKYERRDYLNKEYTNDTINFLREFLPKYLPIWPEVIFQLNNASHELFKDANDSILIQFSTTFSQIIAINRQKINLKNPSLVQKILNFLVTYKKMNKFFLEDLIYQSLLKQFQQKIAQKVISNEQLQILYLILTLLDGDLKQPIYNSSIKKINSELIQKYINAEMDKQVQLTIIHSFDHNIVWLTLCSAKIKKNGFSIDQSLLQIFMNEKMYSMINSLKYLEVYELMDFAIGLSRLRPEVYERFLYNLSSFIIYINERNIRSSGSSFFLNHKYLQYYPKIYRLVLDNKNKFKNITNKDSMKVLQVMIFKNIDKVSHSDILSFLDLIQDPSFLSLSMSRYIQDIKFSSAQLQPFESSKGLRSFQYYNKSLLRFFEGKYNESQVKSRLKGQTLTRQQIGEYFSKIQVYKTIIMDGELNIRFEMPQPKTTISDFKLMYACQRVYQRIKMFNQLDFKADLKYDPAQQVSIKSVDLSGQKDYINRQVLIPHITYNEFRIQNRLLPKYLKLEVWKTYVFFNKECMIDPKDLYLNNKKLTDEILNKVIKGITGSYEKIREVIKQFNCNEELINGLNQHKISFQQHGAAIEIRSQNKETTDFTFICTSNTNYKILYICAYLMAKHGSKVAIIRQNDNLQPLLNFIKLNFSEKEKVAVKQDQEEQQKQQ